MTNANICLCGAPIASDAHYCDTCETPKVMTAWELVGAHGRFRIVGGRTEYEGIDYRDDTAGTKVRISRLVEGGGFRQVDRWIDPDTQIEVIERWD